MGIHHKHRVINIHTHTGLSFGGRLVLRRDSPDHRQRAARRERRGDRNMRDPGSTARGLPAGDSALSEAS